MIIFYVSLILFDGMLIGSSTLNRTTIEDLPIPDLRTPQHIPSLEIPYNNATTEVTNSTQRPLGRRLKRSVHHHRRRREETEDVGGHSGNIVDADAVDSRHSDEEKKRSKIIDSRRSAVTERSEEKRSSVDDSDDVSEEKMTIVDDSDVDSKTSEKRRSVGPMDDKQRRSSRKRGVSRPKRKHHAKRVIVKKDVKPTDSTPGREKRSSVHDRYMGDTLFALELFLVFIPIACVSVVALSLLHFCWNRTCMSKRDSDDPSVWTSEVKVSPAVDLTPKKKMTNIVNKLVTNDAKMMMMAGGDAIGKKEKLLAPTKKKSLHKRVPAVVDNGSTSEPPKSSSSLFVVCPLRAVEGGGHHFPSTATFDSHVGGGEARKSLRLKALLNHQREPPQRSEAKNSLRGRPEEDESPPPRRSVEVNKRRHNKTKINQIEESSIPSSFRYPNYDPIPTSQVLPRGTMK